MITLKLNKCDAWFCSDHSHLREAGELEYDINYNDQQHQERHFKTYASEEMSRIFENRDENHENLMFIKTFLILMILWRQSGNPTINPTINPSNS